MLKRTSLIAVSLLVIASMLLAACTTPTEVPTEKPEEPTEG